MAGWIEERGRKFVARWRDEDGRKRSEPFDNRDDAEAWLLKVTQQKRSGIYRPPSDIKVKEVLDRYLSRLRGRVAGGTVASYTTSVRVHLEPRFGNIQVRALTTDMVQDMVDVMGDKGYAASTINRTWVVLHAALSQAKRLKIVSSNAADDVILPMVERRERATWTREEVRRVIAALKDEPTWQALYVLVLTSGVRPGEAIVLQWSDVDLDAGVVRVWRTRTRDEDGHLATGKTTKGKRSRAVAIGRGAVAVLRQHREDQALRRAAAGDAWPAGDAVFDSVRGPMAYSTWYWYHRELVERLGVTPVTPHGLRHTNATLELRAKTPAKIVADRLGHKTVGMTLDIYSHVDAEMQREAANVLDEQLFGE